MNNKYYVYILSRPDGSPFYVGKGIRSRISFHEWAALRNWRGHKYNIIRKITASGKKILKHKHAEYLTKEEAVRIERELIAIYKRICDGGILANITIGGDGAEGFKHDLVSMANMRSAWKPRQWSEESKKNRRDKMKLRIVSEQTKKKIGETLSSGAHWNIGKKLNDDHKKKLHDSSKKKVLVDGVEYESVISAARAFGICSSTASYRCSSGKNRDGYGDWRYVR